MPDNSMKFNHIALCVRTAGKDELSWNKALDEAKRLSIQLNMPVNVMCYDGTDVTLTPDTDVEHFKDSAKVWRGP